MTLYRIILFVVAILSPAVAAAQSAMPPAPYAYRQLSDPAAEARAMALMHELRCLVCAGQSIADSDAPMAGDMRSQVRQRIAAGQEPEAIRRWLIDRYGSWVSYDPPMRGTTILLWLAPIAVLIVGLWIASSQFRETNPESGNDEI